MEGLQNLWTSVSLGSVSCSDFVTLGHKLSMHHAERTYSHLKTSRKEKLLWMHHYAVAFIIYASFFFHLKLHSAVVVVRSWILFCSSCLVWGSAFSTRWWGDPDSQGCLVNAVLMHCFQSHRLASLVLARRCYFLSCSSVSDRCIYQ